MPLSTFDSSYLGTNVTLSNGNLTATATGASAHRLALVTPEFVSGIGKWYWEVVSTVDDCAVGVGNTSSNLNSYVGSDANSTGINDVGQIYYNGSHTDTGLSFGTNDVLQIALDMVNKQIWYRVNGGNWNGSGTANPATTVGGYDITPLLAVNSTIRPIINQYTSGATTTINLGQSPFAQAIPAGFQPANVFGVAAKIRAHNLVTYPVTGGGTLAVSIASGSQPGDTIILWATNRNNLSGFPNPVQPANWYVLNGGVQSVNYRAVVFARVLTPADITAGSLSLSWGNDYTGVAGCVTFVGNVALRTFAYSSPTLGNSTPSLTTDTTPQVGDLGILMGSQSNSNNLPTISLGTALDVYTGASSDSAAAVYTHTVTTAGAQTATFTYAGDTGDGYAQFVAYFAPVTGVWLDKDVSTSSSGITTQTVTVSPGLADEILVATVFYDYNGTGNTGQVNSVTSTSGLTWTRRGTARVDANGQTCIVDVWWAHAPTALTNEVVSVTVDAPNPDHIGLSVSCWTGVGSTSAPWDPNGALPAFGTDATNATTPSITTSNALDTLLSGGYSNQGGHLINPDWQSAVYVVGDNGGGAYNYSSMYQLQVSQAQTAYTPNQGTAQTIPIRFVDALAGASSGPPPSPFGLLTGVQAETLESNTSQAQVTGVMIEVMVPSPTTVTAFSQLLLAGL